MIYMVCGVYVTIRDGCSEELQSTVDVGDYFGVLKNGCICNPWLAFAGNTRQMSYYGNFDAPFGLLLIEV